jgi:hypothetical protein
MIVAKTVVPDRYWILREDDRKIGNIEADGAGFRVTIHDRVEIFETIHTIQTKRGVDFDGPQIKPKMGSDDLVYGYPTTSRPYNAIFDVKHQVPLWTREPRSRSWLAAGWYAVKQNRTWQIVKCPKLIMLERYQYMGPFYSLEQAKQSCSTSIAS